MSTTPTQDIPFLRFGLHVFSRAGPPRRVDCWAQWEINVKCLSQGHIEELPDSSIERATFRLPAGAFSTEVYRHCSIYCTDSIYFKLGLWVYKIWEHNSIGGKAHCWWPIDQSLFSNMEQRSGTHHFGSKTFLKHIFYRRNNSAKWPLPSAASDRPVAWMIFFGGCQGRTPQGTTTFTSIGDWFFSDCNSNSSPTPNLNWNTNPNPCSSLQ